MDTREAAEAAASIDDTLRGLADPARAAAEQQYLKSTLAFHGTGVPAVHRVVAAFLKAHPSLDRGALLAVAGALWEIPCFECRLAAVFLLGTRSSLLEPEDLALVERLIRESKTWALVDELAAVVTGGLIAHHPAAAAGLDRWAADEDFWVRRSAMLALLGPLRAGEGDWARFTGYADAMLGEREFFIRKAIGWVLRETAKKRPALVATWLLPRAPRASGVTVREAVRYLDPAERDAIMAAYSAGRTAGRR